jgi:hypothetical protein
MQVWLKGTALGAVLLLVWAGWFAGPVLAVVAALIPAQKSARPAADAPAASSGGAPA